MVKDMAEPTELVDESMRINGAALGLGKGTEYFNTYFDTIWKTNFNLAPRTKAKVEEYIGEKIWCKNKKKLTNDHSELVVARELLRDYLDQLQNLQFTSERTLVIGATATDLSRFKSNPAIDFLFNNVDDKDNTRNISQITKMFIKIMLDLEMPMNYSSKENDFYSFNISYETMLKLAKKIKKGNGLERVHNVTPNSSYNTLLFNDSLYDITEEDFLQYFYKTGAHEAYAIMFLPNSFIDPTVPKSKFYDIYYSNIISDHEELLKTYLYPLTVILTHILPAEITEDFIVKTLGTLLKMSHTHFKDWLFSLVDLKHPFIRILSYMFASQKYQLVLTPALTAIRDFFLEKFETVYVTWKNGFQNGYYHNLNSWKKWATKGRFYGKFKNGETLCVDREIVTRLGEMYLLKFEVNKGEKMLVHSLQVEDRFKGIEILDFVKSWNPLTKQFNKDLEYQVVHRSEFYEALQWALGEDINSLDLDIVIVAINRLKAGLSINSTELVPSWALENKEVFNFAMIILLEVYRLKSVYSSLTDNKDFAKQYKSNIEKFFTQAIKYGIAGLTLGLPYAVMNLYYWMVESSLNIPIVNYPHDSKPVLELPTSVIKHTAKPTTLTDDKSNFFKPENYYQNLNIKNPKLNFVFKKKDLKAAMKCEFCALSIEGLFGKQKLRCKQHNVASQKISIKAKDMAAYRIKLNKGEEFHKACGATDIVKTIDNVKTYVKSFLETGIHADVVVHNLEGGPGTGKSTVAREIAEKRRKAGFNVAILSPFSELLGDYTSVTLLDGTKVDDFLFKTFWKSFELKNIQTVFVEEKGAYDFEHLVTFCAMTGVKEVFLVGDKKQTVLQATEGLSICSDNCPINKSLMTNHELVYNFRNNPFAVKMLNKNYGYEMISFRTDYQVPKFLSVVEYKNLKEEHEKEIIKDIDIQPIEEISFSDASIQIFGVTPDDKHTVRSKQGKSFTRVAVALKQEDQVFFDIHGMLVVAISRSRQDTIFVTPENSADNVVQILKMKLGVTSEEEIEDLINAEWPVFEDSTQGPKYNPESLLAQKILSEDLPNLYEEEQQTLESSDILNKIFDFRGEKIFNLTKYSEMEHCFYEAIMSKDHTDFLGEDTDTERIRLTYHDILCGKYNDVLDLPKAAISLLEGMKLLDNLNIPAVCVTIKGGIDSLLYNDTLREQLQEEDVEPSIFINRGNHITYITSEPLNIQTEIKKLLKSDYTIYYTEDGYENKEFFSTLGNKTLERKILTREQKLTMTKEEVIAYNTQQSQVRKPFIVNWKTRSLDIKDKDIYFFERIQFNKGKTLAHYETFFALTLDNILTTISDALSNQFLDSKKGGFNIKPIRTINVLDSKLLKGDIVIAPSVEQRLESAIMPLTLPTSITTSENSQPDTEQFIPIKARPFKFGKDGYRFGTQLDPTFTFKVSRGYNNINVFSGVKCCTKDFKIGSRIIKTGFLFDRTKAGKIKINKRRTGTKYSLTPGYGNTFNGDAVETLIAGQRYLTKKKNVPFSFEGQAFARKITREFYRDNFTNRTIDRYETNNVLKKAFRDMKIRNYFNRGKAELKKTLARKMTISFHNKKTFKPIKNGKLNLLKGGQGIAQTPAWFNFIHCPQMRFINKGFHDKMIDSVFYDNLIPLRKFRQDLTRAINKLPVNARTAITDAEAFDSNQNWFTIEIEKETRRLQGVPEKFLDSYYKCREPGVFRCFGKFSGKTNGEKGSGFLDTLLGNTNVSMVLSDKIVTGLGPSVKVGKGDDFGKIQCALQYNVDFQKSILEFSNMKFNVEISEGGEFCGDTFGRAGCFPSITRMTLKALETKTTKYKGGFTENQISFRDKLTDLAECGINNVIAANAIAEKRDPEHIKSALGTFVSLCHINEKQWTDSVTAFTPTRYQLPGANSLRLPLI